MSAFGEMCDRNSDGTTDIKYTSYAAGYIEEDNPKCGNLILEALDLGIVNSFLEYQIGIEFLKEQIFTFWCALENRSIQIQE